MKPSMTVLGSILMITMQTSDFISVSAQKEERIILTGTVIAHSGEGMPKGLLIANDGASMPIDIGSNGRFWVNVPAGMNYQMAFARRGCVTKIVEVDLITPGQRSRGRISFDVELVAGQELTSIVAGKIGYAGNGRLIVEHRTDPTPPDQHQFIQVNMDVLP